MTMTERASRPVTWLALPLSILVVGGVMATVFRYETHASGMMVIVHDRWTGAVSRCAGGGSQSRCLPLLSSGMKAIAKASAKPAPRISDEEFQRLLENIDRKGQ